MRTIDPIKHEGRRRQILEAAERCFARDGFHGTSMADLCAGTKMSSGHLYHYFASKEALIAAITEAHLARATRNFKRMMKADDPIEAFITASTRSKRSQDKPQLVLNMLAEADRIPALAAVLAQHHQDMQTLLAVFLRQAQERGQVDASLDPTQTAALLLTVLIGAKTMPLLNPKRNKTASGDYLRLLIRRFLMPHG
jgi:AcrR family transcriptional regulator